MALQSRAGSALPFPDAAEPVANGELSDSSRRAREESPEGRLHHVLGLHASRQSTTQMLLRQLAQAMGIMGKISLAASPSRWRFTSSVMEVLRVLRQEVADVLQILRRLERPPSSQYGMTQV